MNEGMASGDYGATAPNWSEMSEYPELNLSAVLHTVLYLLEFTEYPGKGSPAVGDLKKCVHRALTDLEAARGRPN